MLFLSMQPDQSLGIHANLKSGNIMINNSTLDVRVNDYGQNNLKDLGRTMTSVGTVAWTGISLFLLFPLFPSFFYFYSFSYWLIILF